MTPKAYVEIGPHVRLDRPGLSAPAPGSERRLLELCDGWAGEVGWGVTYDHRDADAVVVGPGVDVETTLDVVEVRRGQGIDGFRWALRHLGFSSMWPVDTVRYGAAADHVIDVRRPHHQGGRSAVLLHGGFWVDAWRRDLMDGLAVDLARRGWTTWNVEYRRVGTGGEWSACGDDVVAAIELVAREAAAQILVVGHSAGAQLGLWAAGERPQHVSGVVSLAGLCDLETAASARVGGGAVEALLAGAPAADASPLRRLPLGVPVLLAHVVSDAFVPVEQSRTYAAAATAAGDAVQLIELDDGDHMSLIEPERGWGDVVDVATGSAT